MRFTEILLRSPQYDLIGTNIIDWWPTVKVAERRNYLTRDGKFAVWGWERQRKGTLHTAELLYECRDNPEHQAAVLIAAWAWDKIEGLPESWRGKISRLVQQIFRTVCRSPDGPFHQRGLALWQHTMRGVFL